MIVITYTMNISRNWNFTRFLIAKTMMRVVFLLFTTFVLWEIYVQTKSVFYDGLIPTFSLLGYLAILAPGGIILDKFRRSRVFFIISILLLATYSVLLFSRTLIFLYAITFAGSMFSAYTGDILGTIMKDTVPEEELGKTNSHLSFTRGISDVIGFASGGLSILIGFNFFFAIIILFSAVSILFSMPISAETKKGKMQPGKGRIGKFLIRILPLLLLGLALNGLFISIDVFAAGLVDKVLNGTSTQYTLLLVGQPIGLLIGSAASVKYNVKLSSTFSMIAGISILGLFTFILGFNRNSDLLIFITLPMGIFEATVNVAIGTMFLKIIPSDLLGRIGAVSGLFFLGSTPLMAFIWSVLASFIYFPLIIQYAGIAVIILGIASALPVKKIVDGLKSESLSASTQQDPQTGKGVHDQTP